MKTDASDNAEVCEGLAVLRDDPAHNVLLEIDVFWRVSSKCGEVQILLSPPLALSWRHAESIRR